MYFVHICGRPDGEYNVEYSLKPVQKKLEELLDIKVILTKDVYGKDAQYQVSNQKKGEIILLENLRFEKGETENSEEMAKGLANLADVFVNDAFGTAHRSHASTVGVTKYLDSYAGFLLEKEIEYLQTAIKDGERPLLAILGGAKVSDKIDMIKNLILNVDTVAIVGAMSFTFLKAIGYNVGKSIVELDRLDTAKEILNLANKKNVRIILPVDFIVAEDINSAYFSCINISEFDNTKAGYDIGKKTIDNIKVEIEKAQTIICNGPAGVFEYERFANGTKKIAEKIADTDCISIVGGGDSAAAINKFGLADKFSHISTGGGASLKLLEGKKLPAVEALLDK